MANKEFNFNLFHPSLSVVLSNCQFINVPFEIDNVCAEINYLLTQCGETFFLTKDDPNFQRKIEQCRNYANIVLDFSWEKINTGHWKDVDKNWRYAYTLGTLFKVLCSLLNESFNKFEIIKMCDMGLLMGAPMMQNILSKIAFKMSTLLIEESSESFIEESKSKRLKYSEPEDEKLNFSLFFCDKVKPFVFKTDYIDSYKPAKILGAIADWPALSSSPWSVEYILNKAKFRTVPIEIGSKYTDEKWTQKLMTVGDFVDQYIMNENKQKEIGYLAQHNLFEQIPELFEDIHIPSYISENYGDVDVDISVYFGPMGTISPLHHDPKHNLLAQVIGKKYIRLYSKEFTEYLYPRHNTLLNNTSEVDVENPDLKEFPLFKDAPYEECILSSGELLYIPPGYWHYVRSCSISLSISFWWDTPLKK